MKRTHVSFMAENSMNNNNTNQINESTSVFSGKRSRSHCSGGGKSELVTLNMSNAAAESSGRERYLNRYQEEVAGHVTIPDSWGKEGLLKEWINYSPFDALLAPKGLSSAREALAMEGRRRRATNNSAQEVMRIESRC